MWPLYIAHPFLVQRDATREEVHVNLENHSAVACQTYKLSAKANQFAGGIVSSSTVFALPMFIVFPGHAVQWRPSG